MKRESNISRDDKKVTAVIHESEINREYSKFDYMSQALQGLAFLVSEYTSEPYMEAFSNVFKENDPISRFQIMKRWISEEKYSFEEIYPVSFDDLVSSVNKGSEDFKREFRELSFIFDSVDEWDPEQAYMYLQKYRESINNKNRRDELAVERLAKSMTKASRRNWSIWRLALKYVTHRAKNHLYEIYRKRGIELCFSKEQRIVLTRWIYELARFPSGSVGVELFYKKIMLSYLFDNYSEEKCIDSGMNESILYNLCFNLHSSGVNILYFGNYLDRNPNLLRSCHNYAAADDEYVAIASSVMNLLKKSGNTKKAHKLVVTGKKLHNIYYSVMTNYQIIIIGVLTDGIKTSPSDLVHINKLLKYCLDISGFEYDRTKTIVCDHKRKFKGEFAEREIDSSDCLENDQLLNKNLYVAVQ